MLNRPLVARRRSEGATLASPGPSPRPPTAREFRDAAGLFATGITVVTALAGDVGRDMTANAFTSVSLDPLLVLVCVDRGGTMHEVLAGVGVFGISILAARQEPVARYFATSSRPAGPAQFDAVEWWPGPVTGAPLLAGALAAFECELDSVLDGGDHVIFLGRVLHLERMEQGDPLLYFGGSYRAVA